MRWSEYNNGLAKQVAANYKQRQENDLIMLVQSLFVRFQDGMTRDGFIRLRALIDEQIARKEEAQKQP